MSQQKGKAAAGKGKKSGKAGGEGKREDVLQAVVSLKRHGGAGTVMSVELANLVAFLFAHCSSSPTPFKIGLLHSQQRSQE